MRLPSRAEPHAVVRFWLLEFTKLEDLQRLTRARAESGYALGYGEKFCEAFAGLQLSEEGELWKMNTRKCLQVRKPFSISLLLPFASLSLACATRNRIKPLKGR